MPHPEPRHRPASPIRRDQFQRARRGRARRWPRRSARATPAPRCPKASACRCRCARARLENVERNRDKSIGVTVYVGQRRGNASTSDFSRRGARADGAGRLRHRPLHRRGSRRRPARRRRSRRPATRRARPRSVPPLGDRRRGRRSSWRGAARPRRSRVDPRITNSEGAGVSAQQSHFYAGNTRGFRRRLRELAPFALGRADRLAPGRSGDDMQRDAWYTSMRDRRRAGRARGRRPLCRRARAVAPGARARSGPARCRCCTNRRSPPACSAPTCRRPAAARSTASRRSCSTASASSVLRRAHRHARGPASCRAARAARPSTTRASRTRPREVVDAGVVSGYFLSSYSARKLGMRTTGNAGGSHNLTLTSRLHASRATTSTRCCASWAAACSSSS